MRTFTSRAIATAAAAAIALTTMSFEPAAAGNRYRSDDAAAALIFVGIFGTIAAIVASQHHNSRPTYGQAYGGHRRGFHGQHGHWHPHRHR